MKIDILFYYFIATTEIEFRCESPGNKIEKSLYFSAVLLRRPARRTW